MTAQPTSDQRIHVCPTCKCQFMQPFVCTTCGAERLYDATVRGQAQTIQYLQSLLERCAEPVTDMRDAALGQMKAYSRFQERKAKYASAANQYDTLLDDIQKAARP
jgi:uncharacterized protein YukE